MAKLPGPTLRKRRTREHVIADLSANHVERQALQCGFSVERIRLDYGIDMMVHTYNHQGEIENGRLFLQLKATDRINGSRDGKFIRCRLEKADLLYWLGESMPMILIQYDARKDVAYWLHIQAYFQNRWDFELGKAARQVSVSIPRTHVLDRKAMKEIAAKKNDIVLELRGGTHHAD